MRRVAFLFSLVLVAGCGGTDPQPDSLPMTPGGCVEGESQINDETVCTCHDSEWVCTEPFEASGAPAPADGECTVDTDCIRTGCSGALCAPQEVISTCEFRPEFACYGSEYTSCGCNEGRCGWAQTPELDACLAAPPSPLPSDLGEPAPDTTGQGSGAEVGE